MRSKLQAAQIMDAIEAQGGLGVRCTNALQWQLSTASLRPPWLLAVLEQPAERESVIGTVRAAA
jgi:hypothetical protein